MYSAQQEECFAREMLRPGVLNVMKRLDAGGTEWQPVPSMPLAQNWKLQVRERFLMPSDTYDTSKLETLWVT